MTLSNFWTPCLYWHSNLHSIRSVTGHFVLVTIPISWTKLVLVRLILDDFSLGHFWNVLFGWIKIGSCSLACELSFKIRDLVTTSQKLSLFKCCFWFGKKSAFSLIFFEQIRQCRSINQLLSRFRSIRFRFNSFQISSNPKNAVQSDPFNLKKFRSIQHN